MKIFLISFTILQTLVLIASKRLSENILVTTKHGMLQGKTLPTPTKTMYAFQGIPYAVPPVGELKFQATTLFGKWNGTLNATQEGKYCIGEGYLYNIRAQSEDCLFLNIYTPTLNSSAKLPVIVVIPGGRYIAMSGNIGFFGPGYLIDLDVIVATFNYRLGPFGFLGTEDMNVPGNAGIKDQVLAMKWVKENIINFGGNPEKITMMGQSAGGSSCGLHLMSKQSKGLFRAAICISGSALTPWSLFNSPRNYTYLLASLIDKSITKDSKIKDVVNLLKNASTIEVMRRAGTIQNLPYVEKEDNRLTPCLEPVHSDAFLTEKPYELMRTGSFNQVPLMIGINSEEAMPFIGEMFAQTEGQKLDSELQYDFPYNFTPKANTSLLDIHNAIKAIYLEPNEAFRDNVLKVVKYKSDDMFNRGTIKHALMQSNFSDVFFYEFSYSGGLNNKAFPGMEGRCGHGDDLSYIFMKGLNYHSKEEDLVTIKRMTTMVANFVKYLNPTPMKSDLLQNLTWPKVKPDNFLYVNISENLEIKKDCKGNSFYKWSDIYYNYAQKPLRSF